MTQGGDVSGQTGRREPMPSGTRPRDEARQTARSHWTLERMREEWGLTEVEMWAARQAAPYCATGRSALRVLVETLYGRERREREAA